MLVLVAAAAGLVLVGLVGLTVAARVFADDETSSVAALVAEEIDAVAEEAAARVNDGRPRTIHERRYAGQFEALTMFGTDDGYAALFVEEVGEVPSTSDALLAGYATCVNVERAGSWDPIVGAAIRSGGGRTPAAALRLWMINWARVYLCDPYPISDPDLADLVNVHVVGVGLGGITSEVFTAVPGEVWAQTFDVLCEFPNNDRLVDAFMTEARPQLQRDVVKAVLNGLQYEVCDGGYDR